MRERADGQAARCASTRASDGRRRASRACVRVKGLNRAPRREERARTAGRGSPAGGNEVIVHLARGNGHAWKGRLRREGNPARRCSCGRRGAATDSRPGGHRLDGAGRSKGTPSCQGGRSRASPDHRRVRTAISARAPWSMVTRSGREGEALRRVSPGDAVRHGYPSSPTLIRSSLCLPRALDPGGLSTWPSPGFPPRRSPPNWA